MSREGNLKGAERELIASVDLLRKGFEVFRPVSAASCDILALKYGITLRIEVKGQSQGYRACMGPVSGISGTGSKPDCRKFDVLVRVVDNGDIYYQRSILHIINAASADLPLRDEYSEHTTHKNRRKP